MTTLRIVTFRLLSFILPVVLATSSRAEAPPIFKAPPRLTELIKLLETDTSHSDRERLSAIYKLIEELSRIEFLSVDSGVVKAELPKSAIELMRKSSKGFATVPEILNREGLDGAYSLGVSGVEGEYTLMTDRLNLKHWSYAYKELGIDWQNEPNHTHIFMDKISSSGKPIVFFIPHKVLTHPKAAITKAEFQWLLDRPERMKNVTFVFGAYDIVNPRLDVLRDQAGLSRDALKSLLLRALGLAPNSWDESF